VIRRFTLALILLLMIGCGGGNEGVSGQDSSAPTGSISVGLPSGRILAQISSVTVDVLDPNTGAPVVPSQGLTFGQTVVFENVPVGTKIVRATGFNADGGTEDTSETSVEVLPGQVSRAQLVLTPEGATPEPDPEPPAATVRLFIGNQDPEELTILDGQTYAPIAGSPVAGLPGPPVGIAVDTAGERVFVLTRFGDILGFDLNTLTPLPNYPISLGGDEPNDIAYDPDRDRLYASDFADDVDVVEATSGAVVTSLFGGAGPREVLYHNDRIYIAEFSGANLLVFDANTLNQITGSPFPSGGTLGDSLALDEANNFLYMGLVQGASIGGAVAVFDITNETFQSAVSVGQEVTGIAYDPINDQVLATDLNMATSSLFVLDAPTLNQITGSPFPTGNESKDVVYDPVNQRVIVSNAADNDITVFEGGTLTPFTGTPFPAGTDPGPMAVGVFPSN